MIRKLRLAQKRFGSRALVEVQGEKSAGLRTYREPTKGVLVSRRSGMSYAGAVRVLKQMGMK